jgi:hypothetical protein
VKFPANTGATEEYDGTTWTSSPASLNTARNRFSRSRNSTSSFSFWWRNNQQVTAATEEWTMVQEPLTKTITVS